MRRRIIAFATILVVMAGTLAVAASPAAANCTNHAWSNLDPGDPITQFTIETAPVRGGPHNYCTSFGNLAQYSNVDYHCFTVNESGNTWTHVTVLGSPINGWIWDAHLNNFGSAYHCPD